MSKENSALATYIRSARKAKGLSQEQIGSALGVTKGNVSAWENDRHEPSISQLKKLALETGLPIPPSVIGMQAALNMNEARLIDGFRAADQHDRETMLFLAERAINAARSGTSVSRIIEAPPAGETKDLIKSPEEQPR